MNEKAECEHPEGMAISHLKEGCEICHEMQKVAIAERSRVLDEIERRMEEAGFKRGVWLSDIYDILDSLRLKGDDKK